MKRVILVLIAVIIAVSPIFAQTTLTIEQRLTALEKKVKQVSVKLNATRQTVKVVKVDLADLKTSTDENFAAVNENFKNFKNNLQATKDSIKVLKDTTNKQLVTLNKNKASNGSVRQTKSFTIAAMVLALLALILIWFKKSGKKELIQEPIIPAGEKNEFNED